MTRIPFLVIALNRLGNGSLAVSAIASSLDFDCLLGLLHICFGIGSLSAFGQVVCLIPLSVL